MTLNLSECKQDSGRAVVKVDGVTCYIPENANYPFTHYDGTKFYAVITQSGRIFAYPETMIEPVKPEPPKPKVRVRKMWRGATTDNLYECSRPYVRDDKPVTIIEIEGHGKEAERLAEVARRAIEAKQSRTPDE